MDTPLPVLVEDFLARTGMNPQAFGWAAARNKGLVARLRGEVRQDGKPGRVWPETEERIRNFIAAYQREAA